MRYEWIRAADGVIDRDHPDHGYWSETLALEAALAGDAEPPALPQPPAPVALPAVALAVGRDEAAALLGVSLDTFERHVLPHLRVVQVGRRQLVPVRELEAYVAARASYALRGR